jgi:CIC family chloride channel protein
MVTNNRVLQAIAWQISATKSQTTTAQLAAEWALPDPQAALREPPTPLPGYHILEIAIDDGSPAAGQALCALTWPAGTTPVAVLHHHRLRDPQPDMVLSPGDQITVLVRQPPDQRPAPDAGTLPRPAARADAEAPGTNRTAKTPRSQRRNDGKPDTSR